MTDRPSPRLAVSAALFLGDQVCLVERARRGPYGGLWSLPGGKVAFGETLIAATLREVREETGLALAGADLCFVRNHEAIGPDYHAVIAVHAARVAPDAVPVAADDAADARFVPLAEIAGWEAAGRTTPGLGEAVAAAAERAGLSLIP